MPKSPLCALSATDIATQTNTGTLRCEEVAAACLARIEAREPIVKAWSFLDHDLVLRQAKALDAIALLFAASRCPGRRERRYRDLRHAD